MVEMITRALNRCGTPTCLVGAVAVLGVVLSGCASSGVKNPSGIGVTEMRADEKGFVAGTGVESQDLVAVTDKMARSILATPAIQNSSTPPVIVLAPVANDTRFPINRDLFLTRLRVLLNSKAAGRVQFVARDQLAALQQERAMKQAGEVTSSNDPNLAEFKGGDYLLTGKLQGLSTRTSQGTSDYVLYTFQLVSMRTSVILWEDMAEIKKQGLEDAAYR
jgi:penicillin-binding protein activator